MRREERVTVQGPVKEQQPDGNVTQGGVGTGPHTGVGSQGLRVRPGAALVPDPVLCRSQAERTGTLLWTPP